MDSESEDIDMETEVSLKRKSEDLDDFLDEYRKLCGSDYDLEFVCNDGSVQFYQFVLAGHSEFLRSLLGRFHDVEFSIGDWHYGEMFLLDRRKSCQFLSLSVPDFKVSEVRLMLDLLLQGSASLKDAGEARVLKEIWRTFKIDSVSLDSLEIISEVNLTDTSSTVSSRNEFSYSKLANIKKEITEEVEEFIAFKSDLEVECELCRERFQEEVDLMRHMDYIHQANNTMYDRIKYKRAKEKEGAGHSKKKAKGKGKKSIETKPVRKENHVAEAETESDGNSADEDSNPAPAQAESEVTFKTNNKGDSLKASDDSDSAETVAMEVKKRVNLEKKRKWSDDSGDDLLSNKKSKGDTKSAELEVEVEVDINEKEEEVEKEEEEEEEEQTVSWEDLRCIYCDESLPVHEERPGQNRKKYQTHLLNHFLETQYQEIPDGLRVYQCSYQHCDYFSASRNPYIQHIAFKHDEWFKRINKRIQAASTDPSIAEELEDLSAVKEAFITDARIIPGKGGAKPLWVEGVSLGREADTENNIITTSREVTEEPEEPVKNTSEGKTEQREEEKKKKVKVDPYLQCHLCTKIMKTDPQQIIKNRHSYQVHLMEAHFEASMYGDISDQDRYLCPVLRCTYPGTDIKKQFRYHLAIHHKEFHPRCLKRIEQLESSSDQTDAEKNELKKIKNILRFFSEDARVVDDSIREEKPPEAKQVTEPVSETEEKKVELKVMTEVKKEKDMPEIKVEISEDFSNYLRADSIKSEPIDVDAAEKEEKEGEEEKKVEAEKPNNPAPKKGKKTKKDLKSQNLRKHPTNSSDVEGDVKHEEEEEGEKGKKKKEEVEKGPESNVENEEIQKLHEDIVNSQPLPITIHDEEDEEEQSNKKEESTKEEQQSQSSRIEVGQPEGGDYSCRACSEKFEERQPIIMHIIEKHMIHKFGEIPDQVEADGQFHCPRSDLGCKFATKNGKLNSLLAHLTLRHEAIKITDVTDFIIHNESQPKPAEEVVGEEVKEKEDIKKETLPNSLPVQINSDDNADITWKCKVCKKSFTTEDLARQHVILEHLIEKFEEIAPADKKIFVCSHCHRYSTVSRINFIKHLGMNHHVIPEESFSEYIEQSRTLLLDIDVIKCRCDKKFDKQRQLREHIIFSHCKQAFKHISKGLPSYDCRDHYPSCYFSSDSRVTFVKHLVSEHQVLSEQEIKRFLPSSSSEDDVVSLDDSSSVESVDIDESSIGFDDSVSQAANPKAAEPAETPTVIELDEEQTPGETPFANNSSHSCPVCYKLIAQRSNFEDHLETHGINNDAVFFCSDCDIATSFAQMYHHLSAFHKDHPATEVKCLACNEVFLHSASESCLKQLKDHCVNKLSRTDHKAKVAEYLRRPEETLHQLFRYSCQSCSMFFMSSSDLINHGAVLNSRCQQICRETRVLPIFSCHLCNFSKVSSLFPNHCKGIQHQHKVTEESSQHKTLYGLRSKDQYYVCENCNMSASANNMMDHVKGNPGCARDLLCGLCSLKVVNIERHVVSDQHRKEISKLKLSSRYAEGKYFRKFQYLCESCSFSFQTFPELARHSNCPKQKFRCRRCGFSSNSKDFHSHLQAGCGQSAATFRPPASKERREAEEEEEDGRKSPVDDSIIEITSPPEPSVLELESQPSTSSAGQNKKPPGAQRARDLSGRPRDGRPVRVGRAGPPKVFVFCCETCRVKFSDGGRFQAHARQHDSQPGPASLHCMVCNWGVSGKNVTEKLSAHLVSNRHSSNRARKMA